MEYDGSNRPCIVIGRGEIAIGRNDDLIEIAIGRNDDLIEIAIGRNDDLIEIAIGRNDDLSYDNLNLLS